MERRGDSGSRASGGRIVADRPEQLAALTSPVRMELLELFGLGGPSTVADVAARMGRSPDSLYYHVRMLVRVGLLQHVEERPTPNGTEAIYGLAAETIEFPRRAKSAKARALTRKAIDSVLRLAGRELMEAMQDESIEDEGTKRMLYGRRHAARLTGGELREINAHIEAIEAVFAGAAAKARRRGKTIGVTLMLSPVSGREEV